MKRLPVRFGFVVGLSLVLSGSNVLAAPRFDTEQGAAAPVLPTATLQVSGKAGLLTLTADHADVQTVLKVVFEQMERQFSLDSTVTGQVTLRLTGQPLRVILDNICQQTFLRYRFDSGTGIYQFTRDEEAVRATFTRLRALNAALREQLRLMGLDVPGDEQLQGRSNTTRLNAGFMGAFGGLNALSQAPAMVVSPRVLTGNRTANEAASRQGQISGRVSTPPPLRTVKSQSVNESTGRNNDGENGLDNQANAQASGLATSPVPANQVAFNIPTSQPMPVVDLLLRLGRQANVPIVLDADIPAGAKFRIHGKMTARPLPDALNALAPVAHLEWRWVGNTIFVTTTPDFWIEWSGPGAVAHNQFFQQLPVNSASAKKQNATPSRVQTIPHEPNKKEKE